MGGGGGGGAGQAGGPAPIPLLQAENSVFQYMPDMVRQAGQGFLQDFSNIANLQTNPASQYGDYRTWANALGGLGNQVANWAPSAYTQVAGFGNQTANLGQQVGSMIPGAAASGQPAFNAGQQTYNQLQPFITQALTQGFDPQGQLYAQQFQQNTDQANAANAMAGLGTSPYGAGLTQQANQNFNLEWQNNLLNRMTQGAGAASTLAGAGNQALQGGTSALQQGLGLAGQLGGEAGSLYGQAGGIYGDAGNLLSTLLGAGGGAEQAGLGIGQAIDTQQYNQQQGQIQDLINMVSAANQTAGEYFGAQNTTYGSAVNAAGVSAQAQAAQNAQGGLGGLLGGLGKAAGSIIGK